MKSLFKNIVKSLIQKSIQDQIKLNTRYGFSKKSYSQEGEDLILYRIFERKQVGFYVDVGAHHPFRFSNTYLFYKKGWRGINIEPNPEAIKLFKKYRPRDINLNLAVGQDGELVYYMFNEPALNTFSQDIAKEYEKNGAKIINKKKVKMFTLSYIFSKYLPKNQEIDFLNVDCEGMDFDVLKSNDWDKYRPRAILVEIFNNSMSQVINHEITAYLDNLGYDIFAKTFNTCIFIDGKNNL